MSNTAQLLSTAEVAKATGVAVATVTRWAVAGKLQYAYKGEGLRGFYLFDAEQVEAFLSERTKDTTHSDS